MSKVNEFFVSLKIDLAKGEHLNFSSLKTRSVGKGKTKNFYSGLSKIPLRGGGLVLDFKIN